MAINFYLGGTDGTTDGTAEIPNDGEGLHLTALNVAAKCHLRAASGQENAEAVTVPAPTDCEVSKDGTTWASSVEYGIGTIGDTNVAVYFRRTAGEALVSTGIATTPRLALVTERAEPTAPAEFTPTVSNVTASGCRVTFGTTDVNGDTLTYKVAVTESATPPADWSGYTDVTSPHDVTGLAELTTYYAHVRAYDGALATVGTSASFATPSASDTTPPTLAGTLTATAGVGQVALDWPDATDDTGVTGYDVEYGITTSYGTATNSATSAKTITGLTEGTLYYFRVRAYDAAGNKSGWLTASATILTQIQPFTDTFATLDTNRWTLSKTTNAVGSVSGGKLTLSTMLAAEDASMVVLNANFNKDAARSFKVLCQKNVTDPAGGPFRALSILSGATKPAVATYGTFSGRELFYVSFETRGSSAFGCVFAYKNASNQWRYWNGSSWTSTFDEGVVLSGSYPDGTFFTVIVETNGTQIRAILKSANEATTYTTTTWVNISDVSFPTPAAWVIIGEPLNNAWQCSGEVDTVTVT